MKQELIQLFNAYPQYAFVFSILINVLVAVLGIVPSVFVTAANVLFFGFIQGTLISFAGESIGAFIAFTLYRIGLKRRLQYKTPKIKALHRLLDTQGKEAFYTIILLRFIPFIPSGIITFTAAIGKVSAVIFLIASSLGKIPALLIEAYAAYNIVEFNWQGKIILCVVAVYLLYLLFKKKK